MNISHLKFVSCVAEMKSFSRAAEKCNVTQSTLSNGVSEIEDILNAKIFARTTRSVQISPFGQLIIPLINSILAAESSLILQAKNYLNPEKVLIKIGVSPLVSSSFTSLLTQSFVATHPTYEIILVEDNLTQLNTRLSSAELDFIFVPVFSKKATNKKSLILYEEPLVLITKEASLLNRESVNAGDCKSKKFVMVPDSCGLAVVTRELFLKARVRLSEYEGKALSYSALADWASNGLGSALLPKSKAPKGLNTVSFLTGSTTACIQYRACWNQTISAKLKMFIPHLKNSSEKIVKGLAL